MSVALVELSDIEKSYGGLRPLRIERLALGPADQVAILGIDRPGAEALINLLTGASLPDRGEVRLFGRPTAAIEDSTDWLSVVDRFGIVSDRAVLMDGFSVVQNLAMPFSLDVEPPSPDLRARAEALAQAARLPAGVWDLPVGTLDGEARARVRVARALALDPEVLLLEHPTATVDRHRVALLGRDIRMAIEARGAAALTLTADDDFAAAAAQRVAVLDPASGRLIPRRRRGWFVRN